MIRASAHRLRRAIRWWPGAVAALALSLSQIVAPQALAQQASTKPAPAQAALPAGFAYLRDIDPTIAQDMRYAGYNNFTGRPLAGYEAPECILRRDVALALKRVQADLVASGLGLKVYDCYRPERAVRTMWQWATDGRPGAPTKRFFPKLEKSTLFGLGYIATVSAHSTGTAIDLTLVEVARAQVAPFDPTMAYAACTDAAAKRSPDDSIDMGTGFDCFDLTSHTASPGISAELRHWRNALVTAMEKRGFKNYFREWWHFTYGEAATLPHFDFPIRSAGQAPR
jgi:D-alanyl-D-alanine dipeptidase